MKVLITGGTGQLGRAITRVLIKAEYEVFSYGTRELNITNSDYVAQRVTEIKPSIIINCAALHDNAFCEDNSEVTNLVNVSSVRWLSAFANSCGARLFHFSTDQVLKAPPNLQDESASTHYYNVYSETKRKSEKMLEGDQTVFRVSALYGHDPCRGKPRPSFVEQVVGYVNTFKGEIREFPDNLGCSPGYVEDIAVIIKKLIRIPGLPRTIHLTPYNLSGRYTWFQFAWDIVEQYLNKSSLAPAMYLKPKEVDNSSTGLVNMKTQYPWTLPSVRDSLKKYFTERQVCRA